MPPECAQAPTAGLCCRIWRCAWCGQPTAPRDTASSNRALPQPSLRFQLFDAFNAEVHKSMNTSERRSKQHSRGEQEGAQRRKQRSGERERDSGPSLHASGSGSASAAGLLQLSVGAVRLDRGELERLGRHDDAVCRAGGCGRVGGSAGGLACGGAVGTRTPGPEAHSSLPAQEGPARRRAAPPAHRRRHTASPPGRW